MNVTSSFYYSPISGGMQSVTSSQRAAQWQQSRSQMIDVFTTNATTLSDGLSSALSTQYQGMSKVILNMTAKRVRAEAVARIDKIKSGMATDTAYDKLVAKLRAYGSTVNTTA